MRGMRLRDIRSLLSSPEFVAWYQEHAKLRAAAHEARAGREELLLQAGLAEHRAEAVQNFADEAVFVAGELEDKAERAAAEHGTIENDAFEGLSAFEVQRQTTTQSWGDLDALEKQLEDRRQQASDLRARGEAARKTGTSEGIAEAERIEARLVDLEATIVQEGKAVDEARDRHRMATERKDRLWSEVEQSWSRSFRASMAHSEYGYQARRVRREIERRFAAAAAERKRIEDLERQAAELASTIERAQATFLGHCARGEQLFGFCLVEEFVCWPKRDDVKHVYCVPLIDEPALFNIEVQALQIYQLERERGLAFIEPVLERDEAADDDPRLDAFFSGRPTRPVSGPWVA